MSLTGNTMSMRAENIQNGRVWLGIISDCPVTCACECVCLCACVLVCRCTYRHMCVCIMHNGRTTENGCVFGRLQYQEINTPCFSLFFLFENTFCCCLRISNMHMFWPNPFPTPSFPICPLFSHHFPLPVPCVLNLLGPLNATSMCMSKEPSTRAWVVFPNIPEEKLSSLLQQP